MDSGDFLVASNRRYGLARGTKLRDPTQNAWECPSPAHLQLPHGMSGLFFSCSARQATAETNLVKLPGLPGLDFSLSRPNLLIHDRLPNCH
jgi:hypothetical protein